MSNSRRSRDVAGSRRQRWGENGYWSSTGISASVEVLMGAVRVECHEELGASCLDHAHLCRPGVRARAVVFDDGHDLKELLGRERAIPRWTSSATTSLSASDSSRTPPCTRRVDGPRGRAFSAVVERRGAAEHLRSCDLGGLHQIGRREAIQFRWNVASHRPGVDAMVPSRLAKLRSTPGTKPNALPLRSSPSRCRSR